MSPSRDHTRRILEPYTKLVAVARWHSRVFQYYTCVPVLHMLYTRVCSSITHVLQYYTCYTHACVSASHILFTRVCSINTHVICIIFVSTYWFWNNLVWGLFGVLIWISKFRRIFFPSEVFVLAQTACLTTNQSTKLLVCLSNNQPTN